MGSSVNSPTSLFSDSPNHYLCRAKAPPLVPKPPDAPLSACSQHLGEGLHTSLPSDAVARIVKPPPPASLMAVRHPDSIPQHPSNLNSHQRPPGLPRVLGHQLPDILAHGRNANPIQHDRWLRAPGQIVGPCVAVSVVVSIVVLGGNRRSFFARPVKIGSVSPAR
jgi:hypothetical protein